MLTLQVLQIMDNIWQEEGLDLRLVKSNICQHTEKKMIDIFPCISSMNFDRDCSRMWFFKKANRANCKAICNQLIWTSLWTMTWDILSWLIHKIWSLHTKSTIVSHRILHVTSRFYFFPWAGNLVTINLKGGYYDHFWIHRSKGSFWYQMKAPIFLIMPVKFYVQHMLLVKVMSENVAKVR